MWQHSGLVGVPKQRNSGILVYQTSPVGVELFFMEKPSFFGKPIWQIVTWVKMLFNISGQFNKTFTSVIYNCSHCFQTLKQYMYTCELQFYCKIFNELTPEYQYNHRKCNLKSCVILYVLLLKNAIIFSRHVKALCNLSSRSSILDTCHLTVLSHYR